MKKIGIKLADGSFYPVLEEGNPSEKQLDLTTAHNNQTKIMVDLYRSANCSMEDAEYVDSLQIENLIEHPNGEPNITFEVSLDENNELSARIIDPETGNQSNTEITLVSRTLEERLTTDEYNISDTIVGTLDNNEKSEEKTENSKAKAAVAGIAAGGGLLAVANAIRNKEKEAEPEITEDDFTLGDPDAGKTDEEPTEITEEPLDDSGFNFGSDDTVFEEDLDMPAEEAVETESDDTIISDDLGNLDLPDFEETPTDSSDATLDSTSLDFNLDDNDDFENITSQGNSDDTIVDDGLETNDMDLDLPDFEETNTDLNSDTTDLDLPDFDDTSITDESLDLPDFDNISENSDTDIDLDDDLFGDNSDTTDDLPIGNGLSFTGLYDKETELGKSSEYEEEEIHKKTKIPVIICIICAIICILATALVLFIIPSKYNLINKKDTKQNPVAVAIEEPEEIIEPEIEVPAEPEPIPEPEPVPEAVEDEVIVIEKAEEVVPLPPPVVEEVKPKNITYKIKWGDTLWDIANSYYKNPWKYKYIARFNGIKDPDYIISGTYIIIPAE